MPREECANPISPSARRHQWHGWTWSVFRACDAGRNNTPALACAVPVRTPRPTLPYCHARIELHGPGSGDDVMCTPSCPIVSNHALHLAFHFGMALPRKAAAAYYICAVVPAPTSSPGGVRAVHTASGADTRGLSRAVEPFPIPLVRLQARVTRRARRARPVGLQPSLHKLPRFSMRRIASYSRQASCLHPFQDVQDATGSSPRLLNACLGIPESQ